MAEEIHHPDGRIEHPSVRHETSDLNFRWIVALLLGALVFGVIVHYVIFVFFNGYNDYQSEVKKSPYPLAPGPANTLPRGPRLEQLDRLAGIETGNVYERAESQEEVLRRYGSTREQGFVHIPIDRAMTQLLENKLSIRDEPPADQGRRGRGLVGSGASNSGRLFREAR